MVELDGARQDMVWRCLNVLELPGSRSRYELENFIQRQPKRFLGNYSPREFIFILEKLKVVKIEWRKRYAVSFQNIVITKKGLKFLEDWKLDPDFAWNEIK